MRSYDIYITYNWHCVVVRPYHLSPESQQNHQAWTTHICFVYDCQTDVKYTFCVVVGIHFMFVLGWANVCRSQFCAHIYIFACGVVNAEDYELRCWVGWFLHTTSIIMTRQPENLSRIYIISSNKNKVPNVSWSHILLEQKYIIVLLWVLFYFCNFFSVSAKNQDAKSTPQME